MLQTCAELVLQLLSILALLLYTSLLLFQAWSLLLAFITALVLLPCMVFIVAATLGMLSTIVTCLAILLMDLLVIILETLQRWLACITRFGRGLLHWKVLLIPLLLLQMIFPLAQLHCHFLGCNIYIGGAWDNLNKYIKSRLTQ